jgi:hypothetical protein
MSYTIGQMMQMRQGLGGLFGQPQMGFDPRMLNSITEPIIRFYGQEKMGPFRQELMELIKETFPDFVEGGIMGAIQPYGGLSFLTEETGKSSGNTGAIPLGANVDGIANNNPFGNSIKPTLGIPNALISSALDMGYK